jgi:shikimate kinase
MGCGKTTVGSRLSKLINKKFIDLDQFIELTYNQKIQDIFLNQGEVYFRKIESECLNALMLKYNNAVISLGG